MPDRDFQSQINDLSRRVRELETAFKRMGSDVDARFESSFDGVKRHLAIAIPASVEGALASVKADLQTLIQKSSEAEAYRKLREQIEKDQREERSAKLQTDLLLAEIEAKKADTTVKRETLIDSRINGAHLRRKAWAVLAVTVLTALISGGTCSALSHFRP